MASLNLSANGSSIQNSYQGVVNAPAPPSDSSSTYGQWALFSVQAPLANAFQDSGSKESILKVQTTGEGELEELIEDFSEGRVQFAFVKVKDPNTALPKFALIAWCGGGVPERTKGYFTSHLNAVSKILHGYHVQITARSNSDLEPTAILQKISDASGAKYTAGGSAPLKAGGPPPVKSKPVFASSSSGYNPLVAARDARLKSKNDDDWGDAPQVSRTEIQKVESAYKPTKVNIDELRNQKQAPSRFTPSNQQEDAPRDVIGGGYQPVGKVDIAAIRAAAKNKQDDRPTPVKGAYEPVGQVDIAAIRARSQKPAEPEPEPEAAEPPKSLAERSAAFNQSERLTEMPKPKVAKKWGGAANFTGTKPPAPGGGLGLTGPAPSAGAPPPVGLASRTFADSGGKTPAQLWAEKKAAKGGSISQPAPAPPSPVAAQTTGGGGWKSGYAGKSWAPVQTGSYGRGIPGQKTGDTVTSEDASAPASAGVGGLKDRTGPMEEDQSGPPPPPMGSRPAADAPSGGFALPGMPPRPPPPTDEPEDEPEPEREQSPVRVAVPVPRGPEPEIEPPQEPPQALPVREIERQVPQEENIPAEEEAHDPRAAAAAVATQQFSQEQVEQAPAAATGGKSAKILYDYEKAEDNELELVDGGIVTNIDMVDEDWWMGTNSRGEVGLFPSNYVELMDDDDDGGAPIASAPSPIPPTQAAVPPPPPAAEPEPAPAPAAAGGHSATAEFDYEAAEDNELSFPENAVITNIEFPDEDWWFGHYKGDSGLFPANYVKLNQ